MCSAAQRQSALERALVSRQLVGQEQGILTRASQERNVEVAEVERRLVESGELPAAG